MFCFSAVKHVHVLSSAGNAPTNTVLCRCQVNTGKLMLNQVGNGGIRLWWDTVEFDNLSRFAINGKLNSTNTCV